MRAGIIAEHRTVTPVSRHHSNRYAVPFRPPLNGHARKFTRFSPSSFFSRSNLHTISVVFAAVHPWESQHLIIVFHQASLAARAFIMHQVRKQNLFFIG